MAYMKKEKKETIAERSATIANDDRHEVSVNNELAARAIESKSEVNKEVPCLCYTVTEVASILRVSSKSVYRLVARGHLNANRSLRHLRISARSMNRFIND